jgi:hypothetical protein
MNKLCETNPILEISKMIITSILITSYHSPVTIYYYAKRTQTNPILGLLVNDLRVKLGGETPLRSAAGGGESRKPRIES